MSRSFRDHLDQLSDEQYAEERQYPEIAFLCQNGYLERDSESGSKLQIKAGFDALLPDRNVTILTRGDQL